MTTLSLPYIGHHIRLRTLEGLLGDVQHYTALEVTAPKSIDTMDFDGDTWCYLNNVMIAHKDVLDTENDVKKGVARYILLHQNNLYQDVYYKSPSSKKSVLQMTKDWVTHVTDVTLWGEFLGHYFRQIADIFEELSSYEQRYLLYKIAQLTDYPWSNQFGWKRPLFDSILSNLSDMYEDDICRDLHVKCLLLGLLQGRLTDESTYIDYLAHDYVVGETEVLEYYADDVHIAFAFHLLDIEPDEIFLTSEELSMLHTLNFLGKSCDVVTWLNIDAVEVEDYLCQNNGHLSQETGIFL